MLYLGVDPGLTGAYACLTVHGDGRQDLVVVPAPTIWVGTKRRYDLAVLVAQVGALPPVTLAYLEAQSARPGQGVTSCFSTGYGAGVWEAILVACNIPFVLVRPQAWHQAVGIPAAPKGTPKAAIKRGVALAAARRFPVRPIRLDHADAVMLAVAAALEADIPARWAPTAWPLRVRPEHVTPPTEPGALVVGPAGEFNGLSDPYGVPWGGAGRRRV